MGVAVLPPSDCFKNYHNHHWQIVSPANKPRRSSNPNLTSKPNRSSRRRRNTPPHPSDVGPNKAQNQTRPKSPPFMGQIRILKRGEDLQVKPPEPEPLPAFLPDGFYAGSAFVTSPPPSSLPLPAFFTARRNCGMSEADIASGLRRLLKMQ